MAQLQQQLRLNESHLVLAPLSLLQFKLISSQKFSSTSKHFILISSFIPEVFEALLLSKRRLQTFVFFRNVWRAIWWWNSMVIRNLIDIWMKLNIEISVREVMWRKPENRDILTFDGPKHRAYTRPRRGFTGPHMDHLLLLEMKLSRNLKEIQEKWRWILREIREKSRWLILRLWWYFVYFTLSIFINKLYFNPNS